MNKVLLICTLLLLSSTVFSDANIDTDSKDKTYLLTAPGTLTGNNESENFGAGSPTTLPKQLPIQQPQRRYKYVGESTKFRQFGQEPAQNNPWFDSNYSQYSRAPSPMQAPPMVNPWQVGSMPPSQNFDAGRPGPYSANPQSMYAPRNYMGNTRLYPDFPDGIYRDTNPAAFPPLPGQNGFMPGFGGDNFGLPFSPFDMF